MGAIALKAGGAVCGVEPTAANFFNDPRVHFMRNVLAHAGRQGRRVVAAFIGTAFAQDDAEAPEPNGARSPISCAQSRQARRA